MSENGCAALTVVASVDRASDGLLDLLIAMPDQSVWRWGAWVSRPWGWACARPCRSMCRARCSPGRWTRPGSRTPLARSAWGTFRASSADRDPLAPPAASGRRDARRSAATWPSCRSQEGSRKAHASCSPV